MLSSDTKHWEHFYKSHFLLAVSEKSKSEYFVCWECPCTSDSPLKKSYAVLKVKAMNSKSLLTLGELMFML